MTTTPPPPVFSPGERVRVISGPDTNVTGIVTGKSIGGISVCTQVPPHTPHLCGVTPRMYWPHELEHVPPHPHVRHLLDGRVWHVPAPPVELANLDALQELAHTVGVLAEEPAADPRLRGAWIQYLSAHVQTGKHGHVQTGGHVHVRDAGQEPAT